MALASQPHGNRGVLPESGRKSEEHKHRRRFIGPMPESVLTSEASTNRQAQKKRGRVVASSSRASVVSQEDEDQCLHNIIKAHAYEFFKGHGGDDADWGEEEETNVREQMLQRWRQSEWGKLRSTKESGTKNRWVGTSFDIGTFLGVNILDKAPLTTSPTSSRPASPTRSARVTSTETGKQPPALETLITTPSHHSPRSPTRRNGLVSGTPSDSRNPPSNFTFATPSDEHSGTSAREPLQGSSRVMDRLQAPDLASVSPSNGTTDHSVTFSQRKGKKKQVRYEDNRHEDEPTSPADVLARSGQEVAETSAGAVEAACAGTTSEEGGDLMRG